MTPQSGREEADDTCVVQLRLSEEERIEYTKCAERCGLSLQEWIRNRLALSAKREAKEG